MSFSELTSKEAVERALKEYDERGPEGFHKKYGFGSSREYVLRYRGRTYPSKAIVGVAYGFQYPDRGTLKDLNGGQHNLDRLALLGFTADAEVTTARRQSWIFQGNPAQFDIRGALAKKAVTCWTVTSSAAEMNPGDQVFIWESGEAGGVVAVAEISAKPSKFALPEIERPFARGSELDGENTRALLVVTEIVEPPLSRAKVVQHPLLAEMPFIRGSRGTNWKIEDFDAAELLALCHGAPVPKAVKIAPGRDAGWWDVCRRESFIAIGWPKLGDMKQYPSLDSLRAGFKKHYLENRPDKRHDKTEELWLLPQLKPGDIVVANKGMTGVLAVGRVQAPGYAFRPEFPDHPHVITVRWDESFAARVLWPETPPERKNEKFSWMWHTVREVPSWLLRQIYARRGAGDLGNSIEPETEGGDTIPSNGFPPPDLLLSQETAAALLLGLQAKRFVILTGISGTGKTKAAMEIAKYFRQPGENDGGEGNFEIVAVRPDWTDNRGLLGYFNPLTGKYVSSHFLALLLRADNEARAAKSEARAARPFFVLLDEMNLARVEHYFSDFLSAMESGEPVPLHDGTQVSDGQGRQIPPRVEVPSNLYIIGTVNVDETTFMFSPKVLDRAFVIELNDVLLRDQREADTKSSKMTLKRPPEHLDSMARPCEDDWEALKKLGKGDLNESVASLNDLLRREGRHFGYRVAFEIARFLRLAAEQSGKDSETLRAALDHAFLQKVLPKFHGTQPEMEPLLAQTFAFFVHGLVPDGDTKTLLGQLDEWTSDGVTLTRKTQVAAGAASQPRFPRSAHKTWRMWLRARQRGFTSFIE